MCVSVQYGGKTADRIWMRFGMIGRMGLGMRQVVWSLGIGRRAKVIWGGGADVACTSVTNGEFAATPTSGTFVIRMVIHHIANHCTKSLVLAVTEIF